MRGVVIARRPVPTPRAHFFAALILSAILSCGPELTDPSSTDITGDWTSSETIGALADVSISIEQALDGSIRGQWVGITAPNAACPPGLSQMPTGTVSGSNTVLAVHMSLLGAGEFDGQVIDESTLIGSFASCGLTYSVTFTRAGIVP